MKKLFFLPITFLALSISSCLNGQGNSSDVLNAANFQIKIKETPNAQVIDVRTAEEVAGGFIENAQNIDWNSSNFQELSLKLNKENPVFVYCLSGGRSAAAADFFRKNGFKTVYELSGGIMKWNKAGLPLVNSNSKSTSMSKSDFIKLTESSKTVLVDFYAEWCIPCKKMKPYLDEISKEMKEAVTVIRINADEHKQLCTELGIDAIPVLQVYKQNKLTWQHNGFIEKEKVIKQLQ